MKISKTILLTAFLISALAACSRHDIEEELIEPIEFTSLGTYFEEYDLESGLLPSTGQSKVIVINSVDDIREALSEKFIEDNPDWLDTDFTDHSIVAYRTVMMNNEFWTATKVLSFGKADCSVEGLYNKGDYCMEIVNHFSQAWQDPEETVKNIMIMQVSILTEKIPSDSKVVVLEGITIDK